MLQWGKGEVQPSSLCCHPGEVTSGAKNGECKYAKPDRQDNLTHSDLPGIATVDVDPYLC